MEELVSIIIPVYNVEQYIEECLESIVNQTYTNLDIIIINNNSSDLSGMICQKYNSADGRVQYIENDNKGVSVARNVGLDLAKGEYVCFCDADDVYELDYIDYMVHAKKATKADLVICGYAKIQGEKKEKITNISTSQYVNQEFVIDNIFLNNNVGGYVWNKIFDSKLLEGLYFNEKYQICEDADFVMRYLEKCKKMYVTSNCLYNYRIRASSAVNNVNNLFDENNQLKYVVVDENILMMNSITEESRKSIRCGIYMACVSSLCDYKIEKGMNEDIINNLRIKIKQYKKDFLFCKKIGFKKKITVILNRYFNIRRIKKIKLRNIFVH